MEKKNEKIYVLAELQVLKDDRYLSNNFCHFNAFDTKKVTKSLLNVTW